MNLPVMSYGKDAAAGQRVLPRGQEPRRRAARGRAGRPRASAFPGADDQASNISFYLCRARRASQRRWQRDFRAKFRSVSPGFFGTLGVPILEGRDFNDGDKEGSERVVIISQSLAKQLYPGQDAVNRKMWWTDGVMKFIGISAEPRRIIAVVPDFDDENIIPAPAMTIYQPIDQEGLEWPPVRARATGSLCTGSRDHPHHSRDVCRPASRACQHAG